MDYWLSVKPPQDLYRAIDARHAGFGLSCQGRLILTHIAPLPDALRFDGECTFEIQKRSLREAPTFPPHPTFLIFVQSVASFFSSDSHILVTVAHRPA